MCRKFLWNIKSEFILSRKEYKNIERIRKRYKEEYIEYYNNSRIKSKLKGMSPIQYRKHSLIVS